MVLTVNDARLLAIPPRAVHITVRRCLLLIQNSSVSFRLVFPSKGKRRRDGSWGEEEACGGGEGILSDAAAAGPGGTRRRVGVSRRGRTVRWEWANHACAAHVSVYFGGPSAAFLPRWVENDGVGKATPHSALSSPLSQNILFHQKQAALPITSSRSLAAFSPPIPTSSSSSSTT